MSPSPKVLVIRLSSLGDVILATSVPAVLKRVLPGSHITFLTKDAFLDVLRNNPYVDRLIGLGGSTSVGSSASGTAGASESASHTGIAGAGESSSGSIFSVGRELRAEHFDLIVDLQRNPRTLLLSALVRPGKYTGAATDSLRRHASVRAKSLLSRRGRHAVQRYLFAVEKLLGPVPALRPHIFLTDAELESASEFAFSDANGRTRATVAVCPGARWKTKLWGADKMALLSKRLVETNRGVLVLGGPADRAVLDSMRVLLKGIEGVTFCSGSLRSIAALMAQCRCVVSNDSGLMHVSHSVDTPVVAIFGSTTPEFGFYPPDSRSTVISKSFPCKPCDVHGKDKCALSDLRCMESITVSEVFDAVDTTLAAAENRGEPATRAAQQKQGDPVRGSSEASAGGFALERCESQIAGGEAASRLETPRFLLSEFKPDPSRNAWALPPAGSFIVRVPNWVGDLVMALPTLAALGKCAQGRKFCVLAHERVAGLLERATFVDRLIVLRDQRGRGFLKGSLAVKAERFALGVIMPDSFSSAFLFWLAGIKKIVGFRGEMRDVLLSTRLSKRSWGHLSEQYSQLLPSSCGAEMEFVTALDSQDTNRAGMILKEAGISTASRIALVAPGASYGETKRWPEGNFVRLVELLCEDSRFQVALVGSTAERALCSRIAGKTKGRVADLSGRTNLRDLLAVACSASIFVGNDSGAAHVAALTGCPTVVIVGSSDPSWTAPRGRTVRTIYQRVSCSPCFLARCPYELQCLTQIDPDRVYRTAIEVSNVPTSEPVVHSNTP